MNTTEEINIELRSEETQEVMGEIPHWILRWGITLIAIFVIAFGGFSFFFYYPDKLIAEVQIVSSTPSAYLSAPVSGTFARVHVKNGDSVQAGQILAEIDNDSKTSDVLQFHKILRKWQDGDISNSDLCIKIESRKWQLGELQNDFTIFYRTLKSYLVYCKIDYYPRKLAMKEEQIEKQQELFVLQQQRDSLNQEQSAIAYRMFHRDSLLHMRQIGTIENYEKSLQDYLHNQIALVDVQSNGKHTELQKMQDREVLLDLQQQSITSKEDQEKSLLTIATQINTEIEIWKRTYLMVSPVSGVVNTTTDWSDHKSVISGDPVFVIIPKNVAQPVGYGLVTANGAGKVKKGQIVHIRLQNFPDMEYGYVKGAIKSISEIPNKDNKYFIEICLEKGLQTTYGKELPITGQMVGTAEIIVKNKRLIEYYFQPFKGWK